MMVWPPPRRVLFVDHTAVMGGGEIALLNLVTHLDHDRFQPVVVLFMEGPLAQKLIRAGIETHILACDLRLLDTRKDALGPATLLRIRSVVAAVRLARRLARFIRQERIALVHTNSLKADMIGGIAARLARVPLVWHLRDRIEVDYLPRPAVRAIRLLCRILPDLVIANSNATMQTLGLSRRKRAETIHSGIDAGSRMHVVHDGMQWRPGDSLLDGRAQGQRVIGLVGRISPWKGQDVFLRAAAIVRTRFPEARFQIIGAALFQEQEYERQIHALAAELNLRPNVEFMGFREDIPALVAQMDILVHASTAPEPFGQVVIEGMAAAKPVIATNAGGVREIVVEGLTGLLVPMGDWHSMADAIYYLLDNPMVAMEMGRRGRERVGTHFTIQNTAGKVQDVYERHLRRSRFSSTASRFSAN